MHKQIPDPRVAIVGPDEPSVGQYRQWLKETCQSVSLEPATLETGLPVDGSVDIIVLDCRAYDRDQRALLELIDIHAITRPIVLLTWESPPDSLDDIDTVRWLVAPFTRTELQETVECLYIENKYGRLVEQYFSLSMRRAELESDQPESTLETHPEYQMLLTDLCNLRQCADSRVEDILDRFDRRVFETI